MMNVTGYPETDARDTAMAAVLALVHGIDLNDCGYLTITVDVSAVDQPIPQLKICTNMGGVATIKTLLTAALASMGDAN